MEEEETTTNEIDIIRSNLKDMLDARGEDVSYIEEHGDVVEKSRYYNEIIKLDTDKTTVFFILNKELLKQWKEEEKSPEEMATTYKMHNFILILSETPSPAMMHFLQDRDKLLQKKPFEGHLQIFYKHELKYNPLKHALTPHHEKLSKEESDKIMTDYLVKNKTQMPLISKTDVISRWLGLKHGDIVKITRHNETSGTYYYYRCCM
jgi:DNA-directed RNA polymerase subunit H (RpoH/RPB5)|uniref:RNA polymerase subunit H/Rpb5 C-terminal domain-containing protein n=1 Tax=viral metagenome TaxID=1070528 RepID=A0A6C0KTZ3_9ZZZZ